MHLSSMGHESAFEALVERYRKALHRYCRRMLTDSRAEDAVQQTFLNAWQSLQKDTEVKDPRAWLYSIAHNEAIRAVNKHGYDYDELVETIKGGGEPHDDAERRAVVRQTFISLAALPERQRDTLLQIAIEGRSYAEVAANFGMSEGAVRQMLFRARSTMRTAVSAVVPMPLILWFAEAGSRNGELPGRITELAAVGGSAGAAGVVAKTCAVVATVGAVAAAPVAINRVQPNHAEAKTAASDTLQIDYSGDALSRLGLVLRGNKSKNDSSAEHQSGDNDSGDEQRRGSESESEKPESDEKRDEGRDRSKEDADSQPSDSRESTNDSESESGQTEDADSGTDSEPIEPSDEPQATAEPPSTDSDDGS